MKKKGYHSTQKKYFNTIPKSEFYGIALGYAFGLFMSGLLRIESQIPQLATAVIGFLIGYYVDYKYYRVQDEPDAPTPSATEEEEEPGTAAIEGTDEPDAGAVEETYEYGSSAIERTGDPEDKESGQ